jgi:hypothetical protein
MDAVASRINAIIDSLHFRSFNKVYNEVKRQLPNVTKKEVRKVIMDRKKDRHLRRKQIKPYQIKIFSPTLNCWFMDLIDNGRGNLPRWWHVFIGVNNRYAVVNALNSKDAEDVRQSLLNFILQYHPVKLTSDQEPAFLERQNVQMLKDQKVLLQTVPDSNHSTLGIIDGFIRTLRDMNRPTDNDTKQSTHPSFRHFDQTTMITLVDNYNIMTQRYRAAFARLRRAPPAVCVCVMEFISSHYILRYVFYFGGYSFLRNFLKICEETYIF